MSCPGGVTLPTPWTGRRPRGPARCPGGRTRRSVAEWAIRRTPKASDLGPTIAGIASRAVLVTGGSRGIGAAVAAAFADRGDRVAVHYGRRSAQAERGPRRPRRAPGTWPSGPTSPTRMPCGGMVDDAAEGAGRHRRAREQRLVCSRPTRSPRRPYEQWQAAWRAHARRQPPRRGQRHLVRAAPHARRGRRIVMVSSRGAFRGEPDHPAYGASKAGIVSLGQSLARALGPRGISVTSLAPRLRRDGDGGRRRWRRGRRPPPRRGPARPGRRTRGDRGGGACSSPRPRRRWPAVSVLDVNGASFLRM